MGGAVRKHLYETIKNSELLMSVKGIVIIAVVSVGYMMLAFVRIYKSQSWILATAVTVIGVFLLFVIAVQIEQLRRKVMDVARRLWNGYIYDWVLCAASDFCYMWKNLRT